MSLLIATTLAHFEDSYVMIPEAARRTDTRRAAISIRERTSGDHDDVLDL